MVILAATSLEGVAGDYQGISYTSGLCWTCSSMAEWISVCGYSSEVGYHVE